MLAPIERSCHKEHPYEIWNPYHLPFKRLLLMANVKVFADRQTARQMSDRRTGQKLYAPDLSIRCHKNPLHFQHICILLANEYYLVLKYLESFNEKNYSCRTVALLVIYLLVFDHNATDPVMQKSCNLRRIFSAHFGDVFLHFPAKFNRISFTPLF
jgi:hypothetical protein